jgi:hypothetical protein
MLDNSQDIRCVGLFEFVVIEYGYYVRNKTC